MTQKKTATIKKVTKSSSTRTRSAKKPRPRQPEVRKVKADRDATAGVRANPKNKILFINRPDALSLVRSLLERALDGDMTDGERFEAERLMARIKARD